MKTFIEAMLSLDGINRVLGRKGIDLQTYLDHRAPNGEYPHYMINLPGRDPLWICSETEYTQTIDDLDAEIMAIRAAEKAAQQAEVRNDQEQLQLEIDEAGVAQDALEAKALRHDVVEFTEYEQVSSIMNSLREIGFDPRYYTSTPLHEAGHPDCTYSVRSEKQGQITAHSLVEAMEKIRAVGQQGVTVQRYKGLGEMNHDQLWETTMDPVRRKLLRVTMDDAVEAEKMFTTLMGDNVQDRRAFIQKHAPEVRNLDI